MLIDFHNLCTIGNKVLLNFQQRRAIFLTSPWHWLQKSHGVLGQLLQTTPVAIDVCI